MTTLGEINPEAEITRQIGLELPDLLRVELFHLGSQQTHAISLARIRLEAGTMLVNLEGAQTPDVLRGIGALHYRRIRRQGVFHQRRHGCRVSHPGRFRRIAHKPQQPGHQSWKIPPANGERGIGVHQHLRRPHQHTHRWQRQRVLDGAEHSHVAKRGAFAGLPAVHHGYLETDPLQKSGTTNSHDPGADDGDVTRSIHRVARRLGSGRGEQEVENHTTTEGPANQNRRIEPHRIEETQQVLGPHRQTKGG